MTKDDQIPMTSRHWSLGIGVVSCDYSGLSRHNIDCTALTRPENDNGPDSSRVRRVMTSNAGLANPGPAQLGRPASASPSASPGRRGPRPTGDHCAWGKVPGIGARRDKRCRQLPADDGRPQPAPGAA